MRASPADRGRDLLGGRCTWDRTLHPRFQDDATETPPPGQVQRGWGGRRGHCWRDAGKVGGVGGGVSIHPETSINAEEGARQLNAGGALPAGSEEN